MCLVAGPSINFAGNGLAGTLHWSGLVVLGQNAAVKACNGTIYLSAAIDNMAVSLESQPGSTNATATFEATNATAAPLMLKSFLALSPKVGT
jgi:hypothetical protein